VTGAGRVLPNSVAVRAHPFAEVSVGDDRGDRSDRGHRQGGSDPDEPFGHRNSSRYAAMSGVVTAIPRRRQLRYG
jgi:hypothetical protein